MNVREENTMLRDRTKELEAMLEERTMELSGAHDRILALEDAQRLAELDQEKTAETHSALVRDLEAALQDKIECVATQSKMILDLENTTEALQSRLELAPYDEATEGAEPVPEAAAEAGEAVDHLVEMRKLEGADRIAYYRSHAEAIDVEFERKKNQS